MKLKKLTAAFKPCWASQVALVVKKKKKNLPTNAGNTRDMGSITGSGRSPGGGNGNPLQYSCLENFMDRGAWWPTVCGVTKWSEVKVAQSCLTLYDPMDYTVHGILQARILEWVAYPFSSGSSQPRNRTGVFCIAGGFFASWATTKALIVKREATRSLKESDTAEWLSTHNIYCPCIVCKALCQSSLRSLYPHTR